MIPRFVDRILERKAERIHVSPCHTVRASSVGHPCERYLVFEQLHWDQRPRPTLTQQLIFDEGHVHERQIIRDLQDAGFIVSEEGRPFVLTGRDGKPLITGSIDGKIMEAGDSRSIPFDAKSISPWGFNAINTVEEMRTAKQFWVRKYEAQLTAYLLMSGEEEGCFIFKNKQTGALKQIDLTLDLAYAETLLQKAERVRAAVAVRDVPAPIPWDDAVCGHCDFLSICLPDNPAGKGLEVVDDAALLNLLQRRDELTEAHAEYAEVDKALKATVKGRDNIIVGSWLIKGKFVERAGYAVQGVRFWQTTISKVPQDGQTVGP